MKKRILFIQPAYAHYRRELFDILDTELNIDFVFIRKQNPYYRRDRPSSKWSILDLETDSKLGLRIQLFFSLLKRRYDIIISSQSTSLQSRVSYFISKILGTDFILWVEEWREPPKKENIPAILYQRWKLWWSRVLIRESDAIVVHGTKSYNYCKMIRRKDEGIYIAPHSSSDFQDIADSNFRDKYLLKDMIVILFLGRMLPMKGLDLLILAFKEIEDSVIGAHLLISGKGPCLSKYKTMVKEIGLKECTFADINGPNDIPKLLASCDIFVLPSCLRGNYEGWGLVINEAMSLSKPIITTTAVGASGDLVQDGVNGFVVEQGDVIVLGKALTKLIGSPKLRETMSLESRRIFDDKNNFKLMAKGFLDAIDSVNVRES